MRGPVPPVLGTLSLSALLAVVLLLGLEWNRNVTAHARRVQAVAEARWKSGEAFTEVGSAEDCSGGYAGLRPPGRQACEVTRLPRGFEVDLHMLWTRRTFRFFGTP